MYLNPKPRAVSPDCHFGSNTDWPWRSAFKQTFAYITLCFVDLSQHLDVPSYRISINMSRHKLVKALDLVGNPLGT